MIERPADQIDAFAAAGADCITIHLEADPHAHRTLAAIRDAGCLAGLAINPGTPAEAVADLAPECDLALAMSVNPGWGGQASSRRRPQKVERLRELVPGECAVEVDGGVDVTTAPLVRRGWSRPAGSGLGRVRGRRPGRGVPADCGGRGGGVGPRTAIRSRRLEAVVALLEMRPRFDALARATKGRVGGGVRGPAVTMDGVTCSGGVCRLTSGKLRPRLPGRRIFTRAR